jgi:prepilin-type N-terminal cleavage/methylation domain-containing protein/prepilin-type processing-associated H-X9-DG protein
MRKSRFNGFTLIEVLVVVAIIALLIAILVPTLSRARAQARLAVCGSNLRQIGAGIAAYTNAAGVIPHGPDVQGLPPVLEANNGALATSQIWTGPQAPLKSKMAMGLLLWQHSISPEILYCPGDDSNDPVEELAKIQMQKISPAYCSFLYRQLDETDGRGRMENLGRNGIGRRAMALAMDMNSLMSFDPSYTRTNHQARRLNLLFADGSVRQANNTDNRFSLRDQDLMDLAGRRDEILRAADQQY